MFKYNLYILLVVTGIHSVHGVQHFKRHKQCQVGLISRLQRALVARDEHEILSAIKSGAPVDTQTAEGVTALMYAAQYQKYELLLALILAYRAQLDLQDSGGNTALMLAVRYGSFSTARLLMQHGAALNLLNNNNESALLFAVRRVVPPDAVDEQAALVKLLVRAGADVRVCDNEGKTVVWYAYRVNQNYALTEFLMEYGAV